MGPRHIYISALLVTRCEHEALIDRVLTTTAAIAKEVRDTKVFALPGCVHEDFIEVPV
jgi:hypothetical protein